MLTGILIVDSNKNVLSDGLAKYLDRIKYYLKDLLSTYDNVLVDTEYKSTIELNYANDIYVYRDCNCDGKNTILDIYELLKFCENKNNCIFLTKEHSSLISQDILSSIKIISFDNEQWEPNQLNINNMSIVNLDKLNSNISLCRANPTGDSTLLDTIKSVLLSGSLCMTRNGNVLKSFGHSLKFDLLRGFPLATFRRHSLRMIFEELMWILRGQRDVSILEKKSVNVWTANTRQNVLDSLNLEIPLLEGDVGETYGWNMRNWEGTYDQLANVIYLLKNDPNSRRIIINLWNPRGIKRAALPPCLMYYQFFSSEGKLSCMAMNRSSDIVLAGGWNIATAALLTNILAKATGHSLGELTWIVGDAHIYENNIEPTRQLVESIEPISIYPKLYINKHISSLDDILNLEYNNIELLNYIARSSPKFNMNV